MTDADDDLPVAAPAYGRVYQVRTPRSDWLEVDAHEFARIKDIKAFDWRVLCVIERCEKG